MRPFSDTPSHIVLHHTAVPSFPWVRHGVRKIRKWHKNRGFADIGYHYVVRRTGAVESGRPEKYTGAHCKASNMNKKAIGVCMEGHLDWQKVGSAQKNATVKISARLCNRYDIDSKNVIGHREAGSSKTCPGGNVRMEHFRKLIARRLNVSSK